MLVSKSLMVLNKVLQWNFQRVSLQLTVALSSLHLVQCQHVCWASVKKNESASAGNEDDGLRQSSG